MGGGGPFLLRVADFEKTVILVFNSTKINFALLKTSKIERCKRKANAQADN
jgi:hypothetical protein